MATPSCDQPFHSPNWLAACWGVHKGGVPAASPRRQSYATPDEPQISHLVVALGLDEHLESRDWDDLLAGEAEGHWFSPLV